MRTYKASKVFPSTLVKLQLLVCALSLCGGFIVLGAIYIGQLPPHVAAAGFISGYALTLASLLSVLYENKTTTPLRDGTLPKLMDGFVIHIVLGVCLAVFTVFALLVDARADHLLLCRPITLEKSGSIQLRPKADGMLARLLPDKQSLERVGIVSPDRFPAS
jgi:Na+/proline symporter